MFILSIAHCCFSHAGNAVRVCAQRFHSSFITYALITIIKSLLLHLTWIVCDTLVPVLHLVPKGNAVSLAFQLSDPKLLLVFHFRCEVAQHLQ